MRGDVSDVVVFPDAQALLIAWLRDALPGNTTVVNKVPNPRPSTFITVQRRGGVRHTVVTDSPQIGVECWSTVDSDAHDLAQLTRSMLLYELPGSVLDGHVVYKVEEWGGPVELPDDSKQPRWVFELQVHIRGSAA